LKDKNSVSHVVKLAMIRIEAAEFLGISKGLLDKLDIPRFKAGRRVLYRKNSVEQWVMSKESLAGLSNGSDGQAVEVLDREC
jgi:hypothetical protein